MQGFVPPGPISRDAGIGLTCIGLVGLVYIAIRTARRARANRLIAGETFAVVLFVAVSLFFIIGGIHAILWPAR
jgi:hypothetical protein